MDKEDLLKLIQDDEFGLLKIEPKPSAPITEKDRLVASFLEINQFVTEQGREPTPSKDIHEHQLFARLAGIRENKSKVQALRELDEHRLLLKEVKEIKSLDDIYEDDDLNILDSDAEGIFKLNHVPPSKTVPDYIASRKPCNDFEEFEDKFVRCHADLVAGRRKLLPFKQEQSIDQGQFFVLNGILLYVTAVGERQVARGHTNARLRCIFENGTESDLLLRSLARALYDDGRRVSEYEDYTSPRVAAIASEDKESGYIYVLKSLSIKPEIQSIENLYKIGYSTIPVEERIKNAAKEPTYLMAPVSTIAIYKCYNLNPQKFEQLLHTFFGSACLNVDVFDGEGRRHMPREWFIAPLPIVEQAIQYLISGEIIHYRYDPHQLLIVGR